MYALRTISQRITWPKTFELKLSLRAFSTGFPTSSKSYDKNVNSNDFLKPSTSSSLINESENKQFFSHISQMMSGYNAFRATTVLSDSIVEISKLPSSDRAILFLLISKNQHKRRIARCDFWDALPPRYFEGVPIDGIKDAVSIFTHNRHSRISGSLKSHIEKEFTEDEIDTAEKLRFIRVLMGHNFSRSLAGKVLESVNNTFQNSCDKECRTELTWFLHLCQLNIPGIERTRNIWWESISKGLNEDMTFLDRLNVLTVLDRYNKLTPEIYQHILYQSEVVDLPENQSDMALLINGLRRFGAGLRSPDVFIQFREMLATLSQVYLSSADLNDPTTLKNACHLMLISSTLPGSTYSTFSILSEHLRSMARSANSTHITTATGSNFIVALELFQKLDRETALAHSVYRSMRFPTTGNPKLRQNHFTQHMNAQLLTMAPYPTRALTPVSRNFDTLAGLIGFKIYSVAADVAHYSPGSGLHKALLLFPRKYELSDNILSPSSFTTVLGSASFLAWFPTESKIWNFQEHYPIYMNLAQKFVTLFYKVHHSDEYKIKEEYNLSGEYTHSASAAILFVQSVITQGYLKREEINILDQFKAIDIINTITLKINNASSLYIEQYLDIIENLIWCSWVFVQLYPQSVLLSEPGITWPKPAKMDYNFTTINSRYPPSQNNLNRDIFKAVKEMNQRVLNLADKVILSIIDIAVQRSRALSLMFARTSISPVRSEVMENSLKQIINIAPLIGNDYYIARLLAAKHSTKRLITDISEKRSIGSVDSDMEKESVGRLPPRRALRQRMPWAVNWGTVIQLAHVSKDSVMVELELDEFGHAQDISEELGSAIKELPEFTEMENPTSDMEVRVKIGKPERDCVIIDVGNKKKKVLYQGIRSGVVPFSTYMLMSMLRNKNFKTTEAVLPEEQIMKDIVNEHGWQIGFLRSASPFRHEAVRLTVSAFNLQKK